MLVFVNIQSYFSEAAHFFPQSVPHLYIHSGYPQPVLFYSSSVFYGSFKNFQGDMPLYSLFLVNYVNYTKLTKCKQY